MSALKWHRDRDGGAYWDEAERYCVQHTSSTAIGPWFVTCDPKGKDAGWGDMIVHYAKTMKEAKARAEAHANGEPAAWVWETKAWNATQAEMAIA